MLAVDVDFLSVPTTTLQILLVVLALTVVASLGLLVLGTLATPLIDRRWPADEPLNPTEMLWGESGGYIRRHFPGLDVEIGKDINTQFSEVKVPAGTVVCEQGDPAEFVYVLRSGEVEVSQEIPGKGEQTIRRYTNEGDVFGEIAVLRRTPRTATVRAVTDSVVLQLPGEDFIAGVAFSASEGNDLLASVNRRMAEDALRARPAQAAAAPAAEPAAEPAPAPMPAPAAEPTPAAPAFAASHVVPAGGLRAWAEPDGSQAPVRTLDAGTPVRVLESRGDWAHVETADGWRAWVDGRSLPPGA
jgi:hypothetical protein